MTNVWFRILNFSIKHRIKIRSFVLTPNAACILIMKSVNSAKILPLTTRQDVQFIKILWIPNSWKFWLKWIEQMSNLECHSRQVHSGISTNQKWLVNSRNMPLRWKVQFRHSNMPQIIYENFLLQDSNPIKRAIWRHLQFRFKITFSWSNFQMRKILHENNGCIRISHYE